MLNGYLSKYFEEENVSRCNKYRTSILTSQNDTYTEHIYHRQVVRTRENLPIGKTATLALKSKGNNLSCTWQNSFTKHLWVENNTKKRVKMEKVESC